MKKTLHFLPIVISAIVLSLIFVIQGSGGQNDAIEHQTTRQQEMERYMYTYELDNEAFQKEVYTPDSILNGNTGELLDWFFDSSFLFSDVCLRSVAYVGVADMEKADDPLREALMPAGPLAPDYRRHPAFAELLTRDDALDALESKAIQVNKDEIPFGIAKIKAIYGQLLLRNKNIDRESIEIKTHDQYKRLTLFNASAQYKWNQWSSKRQAKSRSDLAESRQRKARANQCVLRLEPTS